jgi:hypothetical protein
MSRTKEESREYARKWRAANPEKYKEYNRKYRAANAERYKGLITAWSNSNRERVKGYHLKAAYGLTIEEKNALLAAQGGRCGICKTDDPGTKRGWQVDADHSSSPAKVRGILCKNCNTSLGNFKHSTELLCKAIEWLSGR